MKIIIRKLDKEVNLVIEETSRISVPRSIKRKIENAKVKEPPVYQPQLSHELL